MGNFRLGQFLRDIRCFHMFKHDIRKEMNDEFSKFNKFGLRRNWLGNIVYVQVNCDEKDYIDASYDYNEMIVAKIKPIVNYLGSQLGWSEYLVPQISNFIDDEGNPSLSYGVMFIFKGYSLTMSRWILFVLFNLVFTSLGIWAVSRFLL